MENKDQSQDPVVKLLQEGLKEMVKETDRRIDFIEKEIVNDIYARALPDYLTFPVPLMAMLQVQKKDATASPADVQETTFEITTDSKNPHEYNFIPLLNATIFKAKVSKVRKRKGSLQNSWDITLDTEEWVDNLSGLSLYINKKDDKEDTNNEDNKEDFFVENIELYSGENKFPIAMMSDYNHLPFNDVLCRYMQYNGNEEMYKLLMHWHDILCQEAHAYCLVRPYESHEIPLHRNGSEISLTMVLKGGGGLEDLDAEDIHINCFPIINAKEDSMRISDTQRPDLKDGQVLLVDATSENPSLKKRKYGTTRDGVISYKEVYLLLKKDDKQYQHIHYLASDSVPVSIITQGKMKFKSPPFISPKIVDVFQNKVNDKKELLLMGKYHLQTNDRVITPTDIIAFCKKHLIGRFHYSEEQLVNFSWDASEKKVKIEIVGEEEKPKNIFRDQAISLESMIAKRTASLTPIKINITYTFKNK